MGFEDDYKKSDIVMFGIPFDGTTSYRPGTRFGPQAARTESFGLETFSPYTDKDLEDYNLCDLGDMDLSFGNTPRSMDEIYEFSKKIISDDKKILMVGGEHLVTYPVVKSVLDKYEDLVIIHFDAHADLRLDYMDEKLSHATVIRRVWEHVGDGRIFQFGIRSGTREEFEFAKEHTYMERFSADTLSDVVKGIGNKPVYVTIDLDIIDPSIFCGTGTPEPGGLNFKEFMKAISDMDGLNIVGADVVELSPHYDQSGTSTAVACKVIREVALLMS